MSKSDTCGIYKIVDLHNSKIYVGFSKNILSRWNNHINDLNKNKHCNPLLQHSWNKYGKENFKFEIIEECSKELLSEREKFWIKELNSIRPNGYNIVEGGTGGDTYKNNPDLDNILKRVSEGVKKVNCTKEYKDKMSKATSGEKNGMYGKIRPPRKWINNNCIEIWIKEEECQPFIDQGWTYGRLNKKRIWLHKNKKEKWVSKNESQKYLDKGWSKGRKEDFESYKTRIFISPDNKTYVVKKNLVGFCKKHSLNYNSTIKKTKNKDEIKYNKWIIKTSNNKDKKLLEKAEQNKIF